MGRAGARRSCTSSSGVAERARRVTSARRRVVLLLDAALFAAFLVLLSPRITGLTIHEWLGLVLGAPMIVHLLLSWSWIAAAAKRLMSPRNARDIVNTLLNALLFVTTTVVIVSGIVISQVALPWLGVITVDDRRWRATHNQFTTWLMLTMSAHIAMNWRWIVTATRGYLPRWARPS